MNPAAELAAKRWAKATAADRERLRTLRSTPTPCPKCGVEQPSARAARVHCRKSRPVPVLGPPT